MIRFNTRLKCPSIKYILPTHHSDIIKNARLNNYVDNFQIMFI